MDGFTERSTTTLLGKSFEVNTLGVVCNRIPARGCRYLWLSWTEVYKRVKQMGDLCFFLKKKWPKTSGEVFLLKKFLVEDV